jgi:ribosomal protein S6--L-glutamate ligase
MPDRDLGLMFLGDEYIGTYARVSSGNSWNTTTQDGGKYDCHTPHPETIKLAQKAHGCFDLTYTVVDVVEHEDPSKSVVFEVSAFGGFRGAKEGCGMDVASMYADYVINQIAGK